ncbi:MAG: 23S rRNA (adenine(2503)-C(2))-methyltransferase RlmN [Prevotellaceae bacterium]|jgi:23S rRNA (adenine2503-C2)-methyltransferase|nr:23S rRNA (adenine(2503)-C(2))-methyltransferase RlmN [Prevotellaceae bacterium]
MCNDTLLGKTFPELQHIAAGLGFPAFAAKQIADWLYKKKISDIAEMTNLSAKNRVALAEKYCVGRSEAAEVRISTDGTKKYLFEASGGYVETVFIPDGERATLCVSSQVGCKMGCVFCMTGRQGFAAQLSAGEMLNQIFSVPESERLTNLVFMGMGEPFDNTQEVLKALEILTADYGLAWSPKRITVSTIGLIPGLKLFLENSRCHLAVSVHNPRHDERLRLMPAEKAYPLHEIIDLLKAYDFSHQRRVSFEYIAFGGQNDSLTHARDLVKLLKGLDCRVNLIRFHAIPDSDLHSSDEEQMLRFRDYLNLHGVTATIRKSRGEDIFAACGMLSTAKNS